MSIREYWYLLRMWLASTIAGFNVLEEIDAAYEAGAFYGKTKMFVDVSEFLGKPGSDG